MVSAKKATATKVTESSAPKAQSEETPLNRPQQLLPSQKLTKMRLQNLPLIQVLRTQKLLMLVPTMALSWVQNVTLQSKE